MPADRISPAQLRSAVRYNAGRRNWQVKPGGKYPNRASPKLAEDVFTYQMIANAIGPRITADGKLGPQTAARITADAQAGMTGATGGIVRVLTYNIDPVRVVPSVPRPAPAPRYRPQRLPPPGPTPLPAPPPPSAPKRTGPLGRPWWVWATGAAVAAGVAYFLFRPLPPAPPNDGSMSEAEWRAQGGPYV